MAYQTKTKKYQKEFPEACFVVANISWKSIDDELITEVNDNVSKIEYIKVEEASAIFDIYADEISRKNRVSPLHSVKIPFTYNKESEFNIIQQAYNHIKTIPEFSGGKDI